MNSPAVIRPPRVTTACFFLGMSCVIVLGYLASWLSGWGSLETQKQLRSTFHVADVPGWLQNALLGGAAVAAVGIVFAIYTLKGHQASRVILTVFAGLTTVIFLSQGVFGIFPAVFSIACGIYLWTREASQWFAIKNGKIAPPPPAPQPDPFSKPVPPPVVDAITQSPPSVAALPAHGAPVPRPDRPQNVLAAGLITIIMSGVVAFLCAATVIFYAADREGYVKVLRDNRLVRDQLEQAGISPTEFAGIVFVICLAMIAVALGAIVAAGFTLAGRPVARTVLIVLSVPTAAISVFALPFGIVMIAAAITTIILLRRPESRAWFESHRSS